MVLFRFPLTLLLLLLAFTSKGQQQVVHITTGSTVTLRAHSEGALSYLWFRDGEPLDGSFDDQIVVNKAGRYTVIGLNGGCESDVSEPVEVAVDPDAPPATVDMQISETANPPKVLQGGSFTYQVYIVNNSDKKVSDVAVTVRLPASVTYQEVQGNYAGTVSYDEMTHALKWLPGPMDIGQSLEIRVSVIAKDPGMAESNAEVWATEDDKNPADNKAKASVEVVAFKIPNVFTPNGDGQNDIFVISGLAFYTENELMIYNRWGNQVYGSAPYKNDWAGPNLNEGTYYYILRVKMSNGSWTVFKGFVTLIRTK